jgi:hypothetical protein
LCVYLTCREVLRYKRTFTNIGMNLRTTSSFFSGHQPQVKHKTRPIRSVWSRSAPFAMIIPIASEDGHFTWNMQRVRSTTLADGQTPIPAARGHSAERVCNVPIQSVACIPRICIEWNISEVKKSS